MTSVTLTIPDLGAVPVWVWVAAWYLLAAVVVRCVRLPPDLDDGGDVTIRILAWVYSPIAAPMLLFYLVSRAILVPRRRT